MSSELPIPNHRRFWMMRRHSGTLLLVWFGIFLTLGGSAQSSTNSHSGDISEYCPAQCTCGYTINSSGSSDVETYLTNCSHAGLTDVPHGIDAKTTHLDLTFNDITSLEDKVLSNLSALRQLDLRENPSVDYLPLFVENTKLKRVRIDRGAVCCIFEIEWEQYLDNQDTHFDSINTTVPKCRATDPYAECSTRLIRVMTIAIYFIVVFFSLLFNPWIMLVTACFRPRRKDPITFNAFNFSSANLLTTFYAAVMMCYGMAYIDDYHYHMESWLSNPGCAFLGFLIITSTLVSAVLYMLEVISIFLKLRYPLKVDRHMTMKRLAICVGVTWLVAIFIATVPFMGQRNYNSVGLCLPFYADDKHGFKFVIFYTVIMGMTVSVNITLSFLLMRSFMKNRRTRAGEIPPVLIRELLAVEKKILIALSVYCFIALVNMIFLILSCVGGNTGKVGREWYTRIVVLETVTYPLIGPLRSKKFYVDTARLLQKWHCYTFPGLATSSSHASHPSRGKSGHDSQSGVELMKASSVRKNNDSIRKT